MAKSYKKGLFSYDFGHGLLSEMILMYLPLFRFAKCKLYFTTLRFFFYLVMYSPPSFPPLYFVKRRILLIYNELNPLLCKAEKGAGG